MESKYIGSSEQDAARDNELAALRKRVEELEGVINPALEGLERVGWPCRLQELPDLYNKLAAEFLGMKARAEKAERERDEAMRNHGECGMALSAVVGERDKLQADLDAALELCKEFGVAYIRQPEHETIEVLSRVQALLAERAVKHGE